MRHRLRISILAALVCSLCAADTFAQITGFLTAPNGEPVAEADVFINHTTCYSTTDEEGRYNLEYVPPGYHELVAHKAGYTMYRRFMRVTAGQEYKLEIKLPSAEKPLKGRTSAATEEAFDRALLGTDSSMVYFEGTRPAPEGRDGKFKVLSGPVVIEYPAAGYRVIAFFSALTLQNVSEAAYLYQDLPASTFLQKLEMEKKRQQMYRGSLRHWITSIVTSKATEEGFLHPDGAEVVVKADSMNSLVRISFTSPLKVTYSDQVSTITSAKPLEVNYTGELLNPGVVSVEGPMSKPGLANRLPLDYRPVKDIEAEYAEAMRYFYEKIYLQTDKPYYYNGESMWFKAYINYYRRDYRDSLSKVLHVELVNSSSEVLAYRRYPIEGGISHGDIVLPSHLAQGKYYLRAYTNLRLNFGSQGLFTKPIHVLDPKSKVRPDPTYKSPPDVSMSILPGKDTYKTHDKVTLDIVLDTGLKSAQLSVAVTDATQVVPLIESVLPDNFDIKAEEIPFTKELSHRVERGVSFEGQFENNQGRGEKATLTFFQFRTGEFMVVETENDGRFSLPGLQLPDSSQYSWRADKARGKPYGKLVILPRKLPALETVAGPKFEFLHQGQLASTDTEAGKPSRLLNPVEITDSRINETAVESAKSRPFGKANYVVTAQQLNVNSGNLLLALVGKVPGLVVSPTQRVIYFRRSEASSILNQGYPMVTINDLPMGGDPYSTLESIDFNTIESIEFHNRINSLYGTAGAFGVIAVYTKTGDDALARADPTLQTILLPGYSQAREFRSPDYEKLPAAGPDHRSTLFWNPNVLTDPVTGRATVSFFASDLAGMYRIVAEGVTAEGYPLRAETFVIVEERN